MGLQSPKTKLKAARECYSYANNEKKPDNLHNPIFLGAQQRAKVIRKLYEKYSKNQQAPLKGDETH